jgi:hypothetical protein
VDARVRQWMLSFASEEESVRQDVEPYRDASPEELACAPAEELVRSQLAARCEARRSGRADPHLGRAGAPLRLASFALSRHRESQELLR